MFSTCGEGNGGLGAGLHDADGETFEIRYVDPAEAARWAQERGYLFGQEYLPPTMIAYLD